MNAIQVHKRIESETLHLPELRGMIGKTVRIIVLEEPEVVETPLETAETFFGRRPERSRLRSRKRTDSTWTNWRRNIPPWRRR
jgi:hypothetical protein